VSSASLDRLLAILVLAMAGSGLLTLRAGSPGSGWVYVAHGLLAGALGAAVVLKVRSSLGRAVSGRRWRRLVLGLAVTLAVAAALTGGWLWVASGELLSLGTFTVLTLHAWVGLALVPLVVVHLLPRRWRLLRPGRSAVRRAGGRLMTRRALLSGAGLGIAGVGAFGIASAVERLRGGERRFTGSRWLDRGGVPPITTFFGEPAPVIDVDSWQVHVGGQVLRPLTLALPQLRALGETDLAAVLDCTSGWAIETAWRGVPLAAVLDAAGAEPGGGNVTVRSATGWAAYLPLDEARRCLLATGVAGADLPLGNGAPVRLVVPDRRGLDWVKWVTEIEVS